ncbi:carboxypeptidase-like regulatory domain-containing protein [Bacteroides caecigallinarum]|nr:carboxypeptidase-like regulatory domain-containing protein [Bacteroides caecigallinarum]
MQRILLGLIMLFLWSPVFAKKIISGHVVDSNNNMIDAATILFINSKGETVGFRMTDENGSFEFATEHDFTDITIIVKSLGFISQTKHLASDKKSTDLLIKLSPDESTMLKEVVVTAPSVRLRGDTISYSLSAFLGKGDVTLKDAMRNLPGIDVSESGKIKYLGKDISNFYIEGMDLMGGRYNIATENLPASYVTNIEVLNNHQSVKVDKDVFSDNVAINVKLSSKAKLRPMGTYEIQSGYGNEWLYQISGAGMLFTEKFQTILNVGYGNISEFAEKMNTDHFSDESSSSIASKLFGDIGISAPTLNRKRFISPTDCAISLNTLSKSGQDATLRTNVGYTYSKKFQQYQSIKDYYNNEDGTVIINQFQSASSTLHRPTVSLEYKQNGENKYLVNRFSGNLDIAENLLPTIISGNHVNQQEELKSFMLYNDFSTYWRSGMIKWNLSSHLEYKSTPNGWIEAKSNTEDNFMQTVRDYDFLTKETLAATYEWNVSRISFPFSVRYSHSALRSVLNMSEASNRINNNNTQIWFAPQYEYIHPMRKYVFRTLVNLKWEHNGSDNSGSSPIHTNDSYISLNPSIYFNWAITPSSTLRTQLSYSEQSGDITDFITASIRTDNLNTSYKSGILSRKKSFNAIFHYDFKLPLEKWFLNSDVIIDRTKHNLLNNQNITDMSLISSNLLSPNYSDNITGLLNITKHISAIDTKVSLGGSYTWSHNSISQNELIQSFCGQMVSETITLITKPFDFIELDYTGKFSKSFLKHSNLKNSLFSHNHELKLNVFPFKGFLIKAGTDISCKELTKDNFKTICLLDMGMQYKFSSFKIGVDLNNALNTSHYSYTIFSGVNRFSYDYALRGRELLISFSFTR